jgi:hypothetical protein
MKDRDKEEEKTYNCLCTKCNYSWTTTVKPSECPECGNEGIIIN